MANSEFLVKKWKKYLKEKVDPQSIHLSSFEIQDALTSDVWEDDDFVDPEIKRHLERIARDFIDSLGIDVDIDDIVITGSIANYNWSRFSDVDVHIMVDFDEIDENHELVREMFQRAHAQWNRIHNIKVNEHEVELYVQDIDEPHHSTGIYSILDDKWLEKPIKQQFTLNKDEIQAKAAHLMDDIDEIDELLDNNDFEQAFSDASRLKEKIRNFRRGGLEQGGEYSSENLSFKVLRRNGYLERLSDMKNEAYDKMMSLEEGIADEIDFDLDPSDPGDKMPKKSLRTLSDTPRSPKPRHKSLERIHGDNFSLSAAEFADEWDSLKSSDEKDDALDKALADYEAAMERKKASGKTVGNLRGAIPLDETMADLERAKEKYADDPAMTAAINRLENHDPSGNHKYMNWFVKQLEKNPITAELIIGMVDSIQRFHRMNHLFKQTAIEDFENPEELRSAAGVATDEFQRREYEKKHHQKLSQQASQESSMIFDGKTWSDGTEEEEEMPFTIVRPDSEHAACWHGRGTTWCISATQATNYFDMYTGQGQVFYIVMDKTRKDRDKYKKIAWVATANGVESQFDAEQPNNTPMPSGLAREKIIDAVLKKRARRGQTDEEHVHNVEQAEAFADRVEWKIAEHIKENPPESNWQEAVDEIYQKFNNTYNWVMVSEPSVQDHGDAQTIPMYAHTSMTFNHVDPVEKDKDGNYPPNLGHTPSHAKETKRQILDALGSISNWNLPIEMGFDIREMVGSRHEEMFVIDMDYANGSDGIDVTDDPDGFEKFCEIMGQIDEEFEESRIAARRILIEGDYLQPSQFDQHAAGYEEAEYGPKDTDETYERVAVSYDEDDYEIEILIPVNIPPDIWEGYESKIVHGRYRYLPAGKSMDVESVASLDEASRKVFNKTLEDLHFKQKEFPGLETEKLSSGRDIRLRGYISSAVEIELSSRDSDEDVEMAYKIAQFIDDNFGEFQRTYIENIKKYGEAIERAEDPAFKPKSKREQESISEMADVSNEPYQKMARKRFSKMMRLTVKGPQKTMPKGWKSINPKVGKSAPPGLE